MSRIDALLEEPEPIEWLIPDYLPPECCVLVFGDPVTGKSLLCLYWAVSVAMGLPWNGRQCPQKSVAYIAGEGHFGIRKRLMGLATALNIENLSGAPLFVSPRSSDFCDKALVSDLLDELDFIVEETGPLGLIFVDTLHKNMAGDENSAEDIGAFLRTCEILTKRYKATVVVVHHSGHGAKDRSRGSSSIRGGFDVEFQLKKSVTGATMVCHKMKDATIPPFVGLEVVEVELPWRNADGSFMTTAVSFPGEPTRAHEAGRVPANVSLAVETFREAADGAKTIHVDVWREAFYRRSTADTTSGKRTSFHRARNALCSGGGASVDNDRYTLTLEESSWPQLSSDAQACHSVARNAHATPATPATRSGEVYL